jgi:hypothetical protein
MTPVYSALRHLPAPLAVLAFTASTGEAQLRPLEPVPWRAFDEAGVDVEVGVGVYQGQWASLAGLEGRLVQLGSFRASWALGRVALELAGTALLWFKEDSTFAEPLEGVHGADGGSRTDAGDYRLSTQVALTRPDAPLKLALRFGVRLPTTDDVQGLERDQTDFFTSVTGRIDRGPLRAGAEVGLGVFGTRDRRNEQVDVILFGLRGECDLGKVDALLAVAGHHDPRRAVEFRGNEDLGEVRIGLRAGDRRWLSLSAVRGWTRASPDYGAVLMYGIRF